VRSGGGALPHTGCWPWFVRGQTALRERRRVTLAAVPPHQGRDDRACLGSGRHRPGRTPCMPYRAPCTDCAPWWTPSWWRPRPQTPVGARTSSGSRTVTAGSGRPRPRLVTLPIRTPLRHRFRPPQASKRCRSGVLSREARRPATSGVNQIYRFDISDDTVAAHKSAYVRPHRHSGAGHAL